jgi:hypothetical protein
MTRALCFTSLVCGALMFGCGDKGQDTTMTTNTPTGDSEGQSETGGGSSGTTEGQTPTTGGTSAGESGSSFIIDVDMGQAGACDVFLQDCPEGEKCSAFANDGGTAWNDAKCVPIMENPGQPGDPCTVEGNGVSGIDNCDLGSYCWDVNPEDNTGFCAALCGGSPEAPTCDSGFLCAVVNMGVLNLCLEACDPLQQDCDMGDDLCLQSPAGDGFLCVLDASGEEGQQHDPCMFANSCDSGLLCLVNTAATECSPDSMGCCEPFCDLEAADKDAACWTTAPEMMDNGQDCVPFFEEGTAPPGFENVGVCAIPT